MAVVVALKEVAERKASCALEATVQVEASIIAAKYDLRCLIVGLSSLV